MGLEMPHPAGILTIPNVVFYVKWNSIYPDEIINDDEIIEFRWTSTRLPTANEAIKVATNRYNILEAADLLGDKGRKEYYMCVTRTDIGGK
jgi:hypothetical protein